MNALHTCPPHLSDVAIVPWEIQKKSFSTVLFIHTSDFTLSLNDYGLYKSTHSLTATHLPTPPENVTTLTCEM